MDEQFTVNTGRVWLRANDPTAPSLFQARLVRAGRVRGAGNRPGRIILEPRALALAVEQGLFTGRPMFLDHTTAGQHASLRDMAAVVVSATYDTAAQSVQATIRLYDTPAGVLVRRLLAALAADGEAGRPVPDVGLSAVFWPEEVEQVNERGAVLVRSIRHVESVDFVFEPAADGRVLAALSTLQAEKFQAKGENAMSDVVMNQNGAEDRPETASNSSSSNNNANWLAALRSQTVEAILSQTNLPAPTRERLAAQSYDGPGELYQAIQQARTELAALQEQGVVQLPGGAPRGGAVSGMRTGRDDVREALEWLFGVRSAAMPYPELRDIRRVYHLMTGDYEWQGVYRPERVQLAGATTSDLANMAANAMNNVITQQWSHLTYYL